MIVEGGGIRCDCEGEGQVDWVALGVSAGRDVLGSVV